MTNNNGYQVRYMSSTDTSSSSSLTQFFSHQAIKHRLKLSIGCSSYIIGLSLLFFFNGFTPSDMQIQAYNEMLPTTSEMTSLMKAQTKMNDAYYAYTNAQGWFWSCSDPLCKANQLTYTNAKEIYESKQKALESKIADAKSNLGLFSTSAVSETKDLFWSTISGGKKFVERQTWWDLMFSVFFRGTGAVGTGTSSGERNILSFIFDMISRVVMNVFIGATGVVLSFSYSVWSVISSYRPSFAEAFLFFIASFLAALSCACSICIGCCAAGASGAVGATVAVTAFIANSENRRLHNNNHDGRGGGGGRSHLM